MKKGRIVTLFLVLVFCLSSLCACGSSRDLKEELPGEWFVWHWYYNQDNGEDGFFDEAEFYTFNSDGTLKIGDKDGNISTEATYEFTGKDTVDVTYTDGTMDSFQLIPSERDGFYQIQFMNVNTKYTLTLEPISSWSEE